MMNGKTPPNVPSTRIPMIPGTKPSIRNAQLLVSTGTPTFDNLLGGGFPIGSLLVIEEDTYGTYANIMLKYFMGESIVTSHPLLVASQDVNPSQLISEIPAVVTEPSPHAQPPDTFDEMKIAWRYQNMKKVDTDTAGGQTFGHFYDLTKAMEKETIDKAEIIQWHEPCLTQCNRFNNVSYPDLLKTINETLRKGQYGLSETPEKRKLLRIAIHALGSRQWFSDTENDTHTDLLKFLYCLRALLRNSYSVAVVTIPVHNFDNSDAVVERIEHVSDVAIRLESFVGSSKETNPLFKDYHGLLHIKKLPALNTLAPHSPESVDFAFKLRRKKFTIEVLHLPPELGDTTQREQDEVVPSSEGCMGGTKKFKKNVLDF